MANVHPHYTRCGCEPHVIRFCPLHTAALALLEALERIERIIPKQSPAYRIARAAIAQAKNENKTS